MTDPAQVAARLTKAQRGWFLHGRAGWSTIQALVKMGLVTRRTCFPDGNGLPETPLGLAVRAILKESTDAHD